MAVMTTLILYGTSACHLCEDAEAILGSLVSDGCSLTINKVDIADDDELLERYGIRIPVIRLAESDRELGWPFDGSAVLSFLAEAQVGE